MFLEVASRDWPMRSASSVADGAENLGERDGCGGNWRDVLGIGHGLGYTLPQGGVIVT